MKLYEDLRRPKRRLSDDAGRVSYRATHGPGLVCGPVDIAIIASGNRPIRLSAGKNLT